MKMHWVLHSATATAVVGTAGAVAGAVTGAVVADCCYGFGKSSVPRDSRRSASQVLHVMTSDD